jgi:hypothetical protein
MKNVRRMHIRTPCGKRCYHAPVSDPSVDELRRQLLERGYLSHGIERWFALDPWSSHAFWVELVTVALKAAALIALFAALPLVAVMLFRNHPLSAYETMVMTLVYGAAALVAGFAFIVAIALALKLRPEVVVDTPRALLAISFAASSILTAPLVLWWFRFDAAPRSVELFCGLVLIVLFFLVATVVISAALLSFSIYELQRVPALHQRPRGVPMTIAAAVLIALLFLPAYANQEHAVAPPLQVVTSPSTRRVALVAVDGLTADIFATRPSLMSLLPVSMPAQRLAGESATERWASLGTGVPASLHGVRSIEGARFRGGHHVLQAVSRFDPALTYFAEPLGIIRREPLPPTVRRRDYLWEIVAARGVPALAVNWWTAADVRNGALHSISQAAVFALAGNATRGGSAERLALAVDDAAERSLFTSIDAEQPQLAAVYLPSLDVILNRLPLDSSKRLTASVAALTATETIVRELRRRGFDVLLAGLPGDHQSGGAIIAASFPLRHVQRPSAADVVPTLCSLLGFPATREMPGSALTGGHESRIATYGARQLQGHAGTVDDEYYRGLRSLGYIR